MINFPQLDVCQVEGPKAATWDNWSTQLSQMTVDPVLTPKTGLNSWMI